MNCLDKTTDTVEFLCKLYPNDSIYRIVRRFKRTGELAGEICISQTEVIQAVEGDNKHFELVCIEVWRGGRMIGSITSE